MLDAEGVKAALPVVEMVYAQGEVIAAVVGHHGFGPLADEGKGPGVAEVEPGAGKGERGAGETRQLQDVGIKVATGFNVLDVDGDVIQFVNFHHFGLSWGNRMTSRMLSWPRSIMQRRSMPM